MEQNDNSCGKNRFPDTFCEVSPCYSSIRA